MVSVVTHLPLFKIRTNLPVESTILQEAGNENQV